MIFYVPLTVCYSLKFWQTLPGLATPFFHFLIHQPAIAGWRNLVWWAGEGLPTTLLVTGLHCHNSGMQSWCTLPIVQNVTVRSLGMMDVTPMLNIGCRWHQHYSHLAKFGLCWCGAQGPWWLLLDICSTAWSVSSYSKNLPLTCSTGNLNIPCHVSTTSITTCPHHIICTLTTLPIYKRQFYI